MRWFVLIVLVEPSKVERYHGRLALKVVVLQVPHA